MAVWTADQLNEFLLFTADEPLHLLWRVIVLSGLRRGEACGLRWRDVDLDAVQFMVSQQLVEIGGTVTVAAPKTAASRRLCRWTPSPPPCFAGRRTGSPVAAIVD